MTDRAKGVFLDSLDIDSSDDHREFLDRAGRDALRAGAESLLTHDAWVGSFLASGLCEPDATASRGAAGTDGPGAVIGPYKMPQQIGGRDGHGLHGRARAAQPAHGRSRRWCSRIPSARSPSTPPPPTRNLAAPGRKNR